MEALVWVRPRRTTDERRPQPGDVVAIRPDGWEWGRAEGPPDFAVVPIPDLTDTDRRALLAHEYRDTGRVGEIVQRTLRGLAFP